MKKLSIRTATPEHLHLPKRTVLSGLTLILTAGAVLTWIAPSASAQSIVFGMIGTSGVGGTTG
jgi:ABC-type uncharacterized transport system YnjBCD ATPase subunit